MGWASVALKKAREENIKEEKKYPVASSTKEKSEGK